MGDRGNICIVQRGAVGALFLYSHWGGYELPVVLRNALKRAEDKDGKCMGGRWDDEAYLARIIFCEMLAHHSTDAIDDALKGLTGFGITTYLTDNEYPILVVDTEKQTVSVAQEKDLREPEDRPDTDPWDVDWSKVKLSRVTPFAKFVKLTDKQCATFRKRRG